MKKLTFAMAFGIAAFGMAFADAPKYVFLFIGDGMSLAQRMAAEEYSRANGGNGICFNHFPVQAITRTVCTDSLVTDSAAAATAIACGEKTKSKRIGRDASGTTDLESVAYVAKRLGKRVGIATSVTINHATPAGFFGKRNNRSEYYELGLDLIASKFDYFAGGMVSSCNNTNSPAYKGNIYDLAKESGYTVANRKEKILALTQKDLPVLCNCDWGAVPYAIDGLGNSLSLEQYVRKGIELLDNPKGFFFMVEGGSIDWVGHANDLGGNIGETLELDKAVRAALEFKEKHPDDTLILVTGDHETGGMSLGHADTGYKLYVELVKHQKCTAQKFTKIVQKARAEGADYAKVKELLSEYWGFKFDGEPKPGTLVLTEAEKKELEEAFGDPTQEKTFAQSNSRIAAAARRIFSTHCGFGWTSPSHTALPVITSAIGEESDEFGGFYENTEIARRLKKIYADD